MELEVDYYTPPPPAHHLTWEEKIDQIQCVIAAVKKVVPASQQSGSVPPCPNCSFVDMPNGKDKIVAPRIAQGRRAGLWYCLPCCRLSNGIPPQQTRDEAIALWEGARSDLMRLPEIARPKANHTIQQLSHQESHQ